MAYTQIIVLGNGFDLAQHIPSSYPAFFRYRYRKYRNEKGIVPLLMPKLIDDPLDDGNCIWDYLFAVWHDTAKNLDDWKDVESAIKEWVVGKDAISLNDAMDFWEGGLAVEDHTDEVKAAYSMIKKHLREKLPSVDFSILEFPSLDEERDRFREQVLKFFALELHIIEDEFAKYLIKTIKDNPSYEPGCKNTYKEIATIGTSVPLEQQANVILSFNYTTPLLEKSIDDSIYYQRNVHGDTGNYEYSQTFGREYHVIFGIDGLSRMDKPEIYQFTKTARVLELPNQYLPEEMKGRSIFDAQENGDEIKEIKFFGHSLGEADCSYFQSLFDQVDLYGSKTKLTFCYTTMHGPNYDAIIELMNRYGETVIPEAHGRNLLHKLLLEERLKIATLSPLVVA